MLYLFLSAQNNASIFWSDHPRFVHFGRVICPTRFHRRKSIRRYYIPMLQVVKLILAESVKRPALASIRMWLWKTVLSDRTRCAASTKILLHQQERVLVNNLQTWMSPEQFIFAWGMRLRKKLDGRIKLRNASRYNDDSKPTSWGSWLTVNRTRIHCALFKAYENMKVVIYCVKIISRKFYASKFKNNVKLYCTSMGDPIMSN